jgi:hypothetical protein
LNLYFLVPFVTENVSLYFKGISIIPLGISTDVRYNYFSELGSQFFIDLCVNSKFNPNYYYQNKPNTLNLLSRFFGKKMVSIGDSTVFSSHFQPHLAEMLGMEWSITETQSGLNGHAPMASGGSMIEPLVRDVAGQRTGQSIYIRCRDAKYYSPDVIILLGGANNYGTPTGSINDAAYTGGEFSSYPEGQNHYTYYKGVVQQLILDNPDATIVLVGVGMFWCAEIAQMVETLAVINSYNDMIKQIAGYYGCLYVDLNRISGISAWNIGGIDGNGKSTIPRYYVEDGTSEWFLSGNSRPHPNLQGGRKWAEAIYSIVK